MISMEIKVFKNYNIKLNKNSEIHDNYKDQAEKYFKDLWQI